MTDDKFDLREGVTQLNLEYKQLNDQEAALLAAVIRFNEGLTTLTLSHNKIGPEGSKALGKALETNDIPLSYLNIKGNAIGDEGRQSLTESLLRNANSKLAWMTDDKFDLKPGTTSLDASSQSIGDVEASLLGAVIRFNVCALSFNLVLMPCL